MPFNCTDTENTPRVVQATACALRVSPETWGYAAENKAAIADHWRQQKMVNPTYFNGPVWLLSRWTIDEQNVFHAAFIHTEFKAYLYWRSRGFEDAGVWDAFGSGVVRSCDGGVLLGEQNPGNVNAGLSYPPAGFIDDSDVDAGGTAIDIAASIAREIKEETGLACADMRRRPGYLVTLCGAQISIAAVFECQLGGDEVLACVTHALSLQNRPELARIHMVRSRADMNRLSIPAYGQSLLETVLGSPKGES